MVVNGCRKIENIRNKASPRTSHKGVRSSFKKELEIPPNQHHVASLIHSASQSVWWLNESVEAVKASG